MSSIHEVDDALNFAFSFKFLGINLKPAQVKEEIKELLRLIRKHRLETILEIGTERGGTLFLFARVSSPDAKIISIDLPSGRFGGGYPEWRIPFYESFAMHEQKIRLIREDSHAHVTFKRVEKILEGRKLDFLFIDGDHTYSGVKRDFEMYSMLVRKGGIIAFHDICPHPPESECEVNQLWCEIKDRYEYIEIVKDWKQRWAGIGVLYV